ncbi:hypothetical protein PMI40_00834 [Herbaspirillum sp. YR522]|nr:hypothetical protein PMI40_00834 [Herbaspirillum sp. YR522]
MKTDLPGASPTVRPSGVRRCQLSKAAKAVLVSSVGAAGLAVLSMMAS